MSRPESTQALFLNHIKWYTTTNNGERSEGRSGSGFVPRNALQFWTPDKILSVRTDLMTSPAIILGYYVVVWSILVAIGRPDCISWFIEAQLHDHALPFRDTPPSWQNHPERVSVMQLVIQRQWLFCPLSPDPKRLVKARLDPEHILPISNRRVLRSYADTSSSATSGCSDTSTSPLEHAQVYLVVWHRDCLGNFRNNSNLSKNAVLKEYTTSDAIALQAFHNEVAIYSHLPDVAFEHIVRYYGSFVHGSRHTLILEHADGGDLAGLLRTQPPSCPGDRLHLWISLFDIFRGLTHLHDLTPKLARVHRLKGDHQDIRPENIVVFTISGNQPFRFRFKLADFGTGDIRQLRIQALDNHSVNKWGNGVYSAPESSKDRQPPGPVMGESDVWSLGAVLSEVLIWSIGGPAKLEEYRLLREAATLTSELGAGFHNGGFHDGQCLLHVVEQMHEEILQQKLENDTLSPEISNFLFEGLLVSNPRDRWTAQEVLDRWELIRERFLPAVSSQQEVAVDDFSASRDQRLSDNILPAKTGQQRPEDAFNSRKHPKSVLTGHRLADGPRSGTIPKNWAPPNPTTPETPASRVRSLLRRTTRLDEPLESDEDDYQESSASSSGVHANTSHQAPWEALNGFGAGIRRSNTADPRGSKFTGAVSVKSSGEDLTASVRRLKLSESRAPSSSPLSQKDQPQIDSAIGLSSPYHHPNELPGRPRLANTGPRAGGNRDIKSWQGPHVPLSQETQVNSRRVVSEQFMHLPAMDSLDEHVANNNSSGHQSQTEWSSNLSNGPTDQDPFSHYGNATYIPNQGHFSSTAQPPEQPVFSTGLPGSQTGHQVHGSHDQTRMSHAFPPSYHHENPHAHGNYPPPNSIPQHVLAAEYQHLPPNAYLPAATDSSPANPSPNTSAPHISREITPEPASLPTIPPQGRDRRGLYRGSQSVTASNIYHEFILSKGKKKISKWARNILKPDDQNALFKEFPRLDRVLKQLKGVGDGREVYILIDDSPAMKRYKREIAMMVRTIHYCVKCAKVDTNGEVDLFFAARNDSHASANSTELEDAIGDQEFLGDGQRMDEALWQIADKIKEVKKPCILYVLTNGQWNASADSRNLCGVDKVIGSIIADSPGNPNYVGIQFIQFGDREEASSPLIQAGRKRLKILDDLGKKRDDRSKEEDDLGEKEGLARDIVDARWWDDNFEFVLIGSIDKELDDGN